ncbi:MAG: hypothetical protein QM769_12180 [Pseudoxanthomonas sp.]
MPVLLSQHTPEAAPFAMDWFGRAAGLQVLAAERERIAALLAATAPWLWLAPLPADDADLPPRGLRLHRDEPDGLAGAVRCGLPLPLVNESYGLVVVQHALDDGRLPGLLEEVERILQPGGRLWLFALSPFSPWRLRWRATGLQARTPMAWQRQLRAAGLQADFARIERFGPVWCEAGTTRMPHALRAACLIGAQKRIAPLTPAKATSGWRADTAPVGY